MTFRPNVGISLETFTFTKGRLMISHHERLDRDSFMDCLADVVQLPDWFVYASKSREPIRLMHRGIHDGAALKFFDPLTAVYFNLSHGGIVERCFLVPELTADFGMPEHDIVDIAYAIDACTCSRRYKVELRTELLLLCKLPLENVWK